MTGKLKSRATKSHKGIKEREADWKSSEGALSDQAISDTVLPPWSRWYFRVLSSSNQ